MKKVIALLLAVVMLISLVACSSSGSNDAKGSTEAKATEESAETKGNTDIGGKLVIWEHSASFEDAVKAVKEGFNEIYPNVEIEYSVKTSDQYYNLLQTAMQANECPDIFWTNGNPTTNYGSYVKQGLLMDLTDKVDFSLYKGTTAMDIVTLDDGSIYSTPTAETGGRAVFYNKDIFESNGWTIPTKFSEFESLLAKMVEAKVQPIAVGADDPWNILFIWEPILVAMHIDWAQEWKTEGYVAVNDERVIDAYNKLLEWGDKGYYGNNWTGASSDGASLAFSTGKSAMYIGGTWNISTFQENNPALNFGAFQIPTEDGQTPFIATNTCGFAVSSKTQNEAAALAFVNYFATADGQTRWLGATGAIPCTKEVTASNEVVADVQNSYSTTVESYYNILGFEAGDGDSPCNVWEEDQLKILTGAMSVKDFVDKIAALCKTKDAFLG